MGYFALGGASSALPRPLVYLGLIGDGGALLEAFLSFDFDLSSFLASFLAPFLGFFSYERPPKSGDGLLAGGKAPSLPPPSDSSSSIKPKPPLSGFISAFLGLPLVFATLGSSFFLPFLIYGLALVSFLPGALRFPLSGSTLSNMNPVGFLLRPRLGPLPLCLT